MRPTTTISAAGVIAASLLLVTTVSAQPAARGATLRADPGPPADVADMLERDRANEKASGPPMSRAHLVTVLERLEPGSTRPERLRERQGKSLPAAAQAPEEAREAQGRDRENRGARRADPPGRAELVKVIRALPGGAELIERARRDGAAISAGPGRAAGVLAWLNPFRVPEARAQSDYSVTVTPTQYSRYSPEYAYLWAYGAQCCSTSHIGLAAPRSWSTGGTSNSITGPYAGLSIRVPATGWYIVNFRGVTYGARASLTHGYSADVVRTFDYSNRSGTQDYPALVHLTQGHHVFYFIVTGGGMYVQQANAYSL